ncbi:MAG: Trk system potassium transporter TrkA [Lachnospiraceae bacterium]|jgi:trk system potassium uptake protein TrkA|nr:Trk system potassium transporter TrkA [Lachnospiraceae bacterium]MCI9390502.1 Trk system potassium transporter TrkA [Lachnospiraceae bacterium]MCI9472104.1 Trk system potassium transporter TrkA [Lachnospiraceae bacterium]
MQIIIVGCGKVGTALAAKLSVEDHNITIVDTDSNVVQMVANTYDVQGIVGNGASYSILAEAGLEETDLIIAVTESDEMNLLCCVIAKKAGRCQTIARVRDPIYIHERSFIKEELGLSMIINPEFAAAAEISRLLCFPSAIEIDTFAKGRVEMLRLRIGEGCILDGVALKNISSMLGCDVLVCAVERGSDVTIPSGDFILREGDTLSMAASHKNAAVFFKKIGLNTHQVKNTMIIGGGQIAVYLATFLQKMGIMVKIIEIDEKRCETLCELLPKAVVICADGTDEEVLNEERIEQMDSVVTLTGIDEENIILSLYAKTRVKVKSVTKINRLQLNDVIRSLDLDSVVYPKHLTAEMILQYVRATQNSIGSNVETLYKLVNDNVEALEFHIHKDSKVTNTSLQDLKIRKDVLVACISRNDKVIIPGGQDRILPGDSVIVVTTCSGLTDVEDILHP